MRKAKLPTAYKGGEKCRQCKAIIIKSYDYNNDLYRWICQGCNATRYESGAKFETRFVGASDL